jgi:hypothetical protein
VLRTRSSLPKSGQGIDPTPLSSTEPYIQCICTMKLTKHLHLAPQTLTYYCTKPTSHALSQSVTTFTSLSYYLFIHLQRGLIMGKPMGRHPITHYINPSKPFSWSMSPKNKQDTMISALLGCSIFDQPIEVPKLVKQDQCFLKTCSRANKPPTLTCDSSRVTQIWETLMLSPLLSLE